MLFYIKRHLWLEVTLTIPLARLGPRGMHALNLPLHLKPRPFDVVVGVLGLLRSGCGLCWCSMATESSKGMLSRNS
jgi:hypothetical protein